MTSNTTIDFAIANRAFSAVSQGVELYTAAGMSRAEAMAKTLTALSRYVEAMQSVTAGRAASTDKTEDGGTGSSHH